MNLSLAELQRDHKEWVARNFPRSLPHQPLLGLAEEVGELSHAHLKHEQGIRGYTTARYMDEAADAVGDIIIYLASYCNANGLDLQWCVQHTWDRVRNRDWQADPEKGGEVATASTDHI